MKLALLGDVHLADHPPSIRTEDYVDQILEKLAFVVEDSAQKGCEVLIQAGDLFHIKAPSRTSHRLVQATVDVLSTFPGPVLVVPGNHDMQHDRIESLARQPLGSLCKASGIDMLIGKHPDLPVFGIPYLYDWTVLLPGWMKKYRESKSDLLVTHAPIFPDGDEPPYDYLLASEWSDLQDHGECYYGHIHDVHGTYTYGSVTFCNQGALSRGSLHEATLRRKPAYTIWDDVLGFARVEVPHRPVEEVFRLAAKEDVDERQDRVAGFLAGVEQTELGVLSLEAVIVAARDKGLRPRALEQLEDCLEAVQ